MHVARLRAADVARYRELMLHGYEHAPDAFTSTPEERAVEPESWWVQRVAGPQGLCVAFGAFASAQLVGAVALEFSAKPKTRHKAHLIGMYVLESHRGMRVGKQLVDAAVECVRARPGLAVMTLTVTEGNAAAITLYEAAGFRIFGTEPMAIRTAGGYKSKVHMWLPLADRPPAA